MLWSLLHRSIQAATQSNTQYAKNILSLHWRHNDHDGVSNHQPHGCLLNRLFRRRSQKTSKLRVTGLCVGNSPGPVNSSHKGPVTKKMFPFYDVIMVQQIVFFVHFKIPYYINAFNNILYVTHYIWNFYLRTVPCITKVVYCYQSVDRNMLTTASI